MLGCLGEVRGRSFGLAGIELMFKVVSLVLATAA